MLTDVIRQSPKDRPARARTYLSSLFVVGCAPLLKGSCRLLISSIVLDAPALRDDYYCSLLAYSDTVECLAVGLGPHVYLWSEKHAGKEIPDSLTAPFGSAHVTSVSFSSLGGGNAILAIGRADGRITLWSPLDREPRFDSEQPASVSGVCFRPTTARRGSVRDGTTMVDTEELLVGDEAGFVYYYSIEWPSQDQRDLFDWHGSMTLLARMSCHTQQICGLAWSSDGEIFATGGNDNKLFLFERKRILFPRQDVRAKTPSSPLSVRDSTSTGTVAGQGEILSIEPGQERHVFSLNAAVKAIAFAPWQPSLLAAGGGSNDRCIRFFHALSGVPLATIDCHAQVTSLVWSPRRRELAATFGFAQPDHSFRVAVFAWPSCDLVVRIPWWNEERALYAVAYPRGPSGGGGGSRNTNHSADSPSPSTPRRRRGRPRRTDITAARTPTRTHVDDAAEGGSWCARRTREEGCLVIATSDASIKFHEIWAEGTTSMAGGGRGARDRGDDARLLTGSPILEGEYCSEAVMREAGDSVEEGVQPRDLGLAGDTTGVIEVVEVVT